MQLSFGNFQRSPTHSVLTAHSHTENKISQPNELDSKFMGHLCILERPVIRVRCEYPVLIVKMTSIV